MQVRISTTISTIVELTSGASLEEAKKEIFERYLQNLDGDNYCVEDLQDSQQRCVAFDTPLASEVTHSFEEVK